MPNCNFYAVDEDFKLILDLVFNELKCNVYQKYSEPNAELIQFHSSAEVIEYYQLNSFSTQMSKSAHLMLWPTEASDNFVISNQVINSKKFKGATRQRAEGWGLIQLELQSNSVKGLKPSQTNNSSEKRARAWESKSQEELGLVSEWKWDVVVRTAKKLNDYIRNKSNKKIGATAVLPNAAKLTLAE